MIHVYAITATLQLGSISSAHLGEARVQKDYAKAQLRNEQQVQIVTPSFTMLLMAELIIFIKSLMYSCNMLISEKVAGDKYLGNL